MLRSHTTVTSSIHIEQHGLKHELFKGDILSPEGNHYSKSALDVRMDELWKNQSKPSNRKRFYFMTMN